MSEPSSSPAGSGSSSPGRYALLVDSVRDYAILTLDLGGKVTTWNTGAALLTGYAADEAIGQHFSRLYPPDAIADGLPRHEFQAAVATGRLEVEGWRLRKDGTRFWGSVVTTRMCSTAGETLGYSQIIRDLSARRAQELELRRSEERFRLLVTGVKDYAIFMLDTRGRVATWNAGAELIKGYAAHEIIGRHFSTFYPPEAIRRNLPETELHGAMLQGRYEDEGWRIRKDGSRFWANVIITAVRNAAGELVGFSKITRNLSERRQHEEQLRQSEERFRLLVEGVTEYAIMMLDADGFVTSWNAGAQRIKGYMAAEILGRHVSHFYPSEAILENRPWQELAEARTTGRAECEGWRVRKDGTLFWAKTIVTALYDHEHKLYGFAKVTQDLTAHRHAASLAETAQRMHEFIAMLAHELRNPLAPIRNAVALMAKKGLKDPLLESMRQTIDRQSVQLSRLLDELLDVNRIARGKFTIERAPVDLREVVARATEASKPLIDQRRHTLRINLPERPAQALGDSVRLTQALVNLLNNAAKYTPEGGIIQVTLESRGADLHLRVSDNGKGIERDKLERVFDLFVQLDPTSGDALGGLGVGLALVRRVVELHGGSVEARSAGPGLGSEFLIRLPQSIHPPRAVAEPTGAQVASALPMLRVMIVDDNRDSADTLNLLLQELGQQSCAMYDGATAIAAAGTFQPELVLLDIGMPYLSGYEVASQLRALPWKTPPVLVAITGWGQDADKVRAEGAGFAAHFVKPINEAALRELLIDTATRLGKKLSFQ